MVDVSTEPDLLLARWRATGLPTSTEAASARSAAKEVARLGAVQAQEFEMTLWSLGRRTGQPRADVLADVDNGAVVRTHTLRPTWHFVHRDDLTRVQSATAHRVRATMAAAYRELELDDGLLRRCGALLVDAAEEPVTRTAAAAVLKGAGIPATGMRLGLILMWAELGCLLVSGPRSGKQHTYAAFDHAGLPERTDAVRWLVERYLAAHGPATVDDLAAWSSLRRSEIGPALAELGPLVQQTSVAGRDWLWIGDLSVDPWASPQVELLNGYDEYVSGFGPSGKRLLDRAGLYRDRPGTPVGLVMVDGQLLGHWRRATTPTAVRVDVLALRPLGEQEWSALRRSAQRLGGFLGLTPTITTVPAT